MGQMGSPEKELGTDRSPDSQAVAEVHHAVGKAVLLSQLEPDSYTWWQGSLSAADEDRIEQEVAFVYQPRGDRSARDRGSSDGQIRR